MAQGPVQVEALAPNDDGRAVGRPDHVHRQRRRSDDRHDHGSRARSPTTTGASGPGSSSTSSVTLTTDPRAIVVPTAAVQTGQQGQYVFVVKPDQTVELRPVDGRRAPSATSRSSSRGSSPARRSSPTASCGSIPGSRVSVKSGPGRRGPRHESFRRSSSSGRSRRRCIMLGIVVFGVMAYRQLPVSDLPTVDFPTIQVQRQPARRQPGDDGLGGRAAAREAVLDDRRRRRRSPRRARRAARNITLQFDLSRNIDAAAQDVQAMIARAARALPPQMPAPPSYQKVNPARPAGPVPGAALGDAAAVDASTSTPRSTLAQRISMVSGVAQVQVFGAQKYAVRVDVDPRKLAARGIGIDEVATRDRRTRNVEPADRHALRRRSRRFTRAGRTASCCSAAAYRPADRRLPQRQPGAARRGRARLRRRRERQDRRAGINGERAIYLAIQQQPGTNTVAVVDAVKTLLPTFQRAAAAVGHARRPQRPLGVDPRVGRTT